MPDEICVGDFVRITNDYMWKEQGFFKNASWVLEREPVRVEIINDSFVVISRNCQFYSPFPLDCIEKIWRPVFTLNQDVILKEDIGVFSKGTKGKILEHICLQTGSTIDKIECFYGWCSDEDDNMIFPMSVPETLLMSITS